MKLKIFKPNTHLEKLSPLEIMSIDFTILNGIVCGEPEVFRGVKRSASYFLDEAQTDLAIKKTFSDVFDKSGFLIGLRIRFEWFDERGNPALQKEQYVPLSIAESAELVRGRRKRQINYLQEAGVRMGVKQYIDALFGFYSSYVVNGTTKNLLNNYIENGTNEFKDAINAEQNPQILAILNAKLPTKETVKDAIIQQMS